MKKLKAFADNPVIGGMVKKAISTLASNDAKNISEHFSKYLKPQIAIGDPLKQEVFQLRHNVYCEELQFEEIKPDHLEYDEFDAHSIHCFIRHLSSSRMAGTVRLITSDSTKQLLPIEKYCLHAIEDKAFSPSNFDREQICEFSRLAVPALFRKRAIDKFAGAATGVIDETLFSPNELRCFPYIAICLYMAAAATAFHTNRLHAFVMMEPRLARSLSFVGITFRQLGAPIEYHGKRAAYYINSDMFRNNISSGYIKLMKLVEKELFLAEGANRNIATTAIPNFFSALADEGKLC